MQSDIITNIQLVLIFSIFFNRILNINFKKTEAIDIPITPMLIQLFK